MQAVRTKNGGLGKAIYGAACGLHFAELGPADIEVGSVRAPSIDEVDGVVCFEDGADAITDDGGCAGQDGADPFVAAMVSDRCRFKRPGR